MAKEDDVNRKQKIVVETLEDAGREIGDIRDIVDAFGDQAFGDRRNRERFAASLQGRLEAVESEVGTAKAFIANFKGSVDKLTTTAVTAVIVGIIGFIIARVTGG